MDVLLLGATGKVGGPILDELLARGHEVTAFVRDPTRLPDQTARLHHRPGDVFDPDAVADALVVVDVVICSVAMRDAAQHDRTPQALMHTVANAAASAGVRLVTLGGAGSLRTASGADLVDTPVFPEAARVESLGFREALHWLQEAAPPGLTWSMISPPASIEVGGPRTGSYRTAHDTLIVDAEGASRISAADLAVATVDEVEEPKNAQRRFTVGY